MFGFIVVVIRFNKANSRLEKKIHILIGYERSKKYMIYKSEYVLHKKMFCPFRLIGKTNW